MYIHFFKTSKTCYVIVSPDCRPIGEEKEVSGKKEAKQIAKDNGYIPWNF